MLRLLPDSVTDDDEALASWRIGGRTDADERFTLRILHSVVFEAKRCGLLRAKTDDPFRYRSQSEAMMRRFFADNLDVLASLAERWRREWVRGAFGPEFRLMLRHVEASGTGPWGRDPNDGRGEAPGERS